MLEDSWLGRAVETVSGWGHRAAETGAAWIRASYLYRWLTAEPDPEVIVIDLRETYTVGPVIAALEWVGTRVAPWWRASAVNDILATVGERLEGWAERSRVVRLLRALLVPPDLDEERRR